METSNILDSSLNCCLKCKGLFKVSSEENNKHLISCSGNPFKSPTSYFACERNIFLQLFQPEDFQLDGSFNLLNISKDDSFLNQVVKIRLQQETFDPLLFLRNYTTSGTSTLPVSSLDLLDENITDLDSDVNKDVSFINNEKPTFSVTEEEDQIENIINKNLDYLKHDSMSDLHSGSGKQPFTQSTSEGRLLSPIEKQLDFLTDESKLQSPFDKETGFLPETNDEYQSDTLNFATTQPVPFACTLSTDLLGDLNVSQNVNQATLTRIGEPCQTLQHLDIAKKDPFLGQNPGLAHLNSKDPFLINASVRSEKPPYMVQRYPSVKSFFDMHTSPTFQLQDGNYFNFPSMLDEPTQLAYLDLATIDFLTNPNFNYGLKEKSQSEKNEVSTELSTSGQDLTMPALSFDRFDKNMALPTRTMDDSAVDRKMKRLRMKKVKSRLPKKTRSVMYTDKDNLNSKSSDTSPRSRRLSAKDTDKSILKINNSRHNIVGESSEAPEKSTDRTRGTSRKRKLSLPSTLDVKTTDDQPKEKGEMKMNVKTRLCQSGEIFNVKERLTGFTEEEKESFKAVIGKNTCVLVKKQKLMPYYKPPIIAKVNELMIVNQQCSERPDLDTGVVSINTDEPNTSFNNNTDWEGRDDMFTKSPGCRDTCGSDHREDDRNSFANPSRKQIVFTCFECEFTCESVTLLADHVKLHNATSDSDADQNNQTEIDDSIQTNIHTEEAYNNSVESRNKHVIDTLCEGDKSGNILVNDNSPKVNVHHDLNNKVHDHLQECMVENEHTKSIVSEEIVNEIDHETSLIGTADSLFQETANLDVIFTENVHLLDPPSQSLGSLFNEQKIIKEILEPPEIQNEGRHLDEENTRGSLLNTTTTVLYNKVPDTCDDAKYDSGDLTKYDSEHRTDICLDGNSLPVYSTKEHNWQCSGINEEIKSTSTDLQQKTCPDLGEHSCCDIDLHHERSAKKEIDRSKSFVSDKESNELNEVTSEEIITTDQAQNDKATLTDFNICSPEELKLNDAEFNTPKSYIVYVDEASANHGADTCKDSEDFLNTQNHDVPSDAHLTDSLSNEHTYSKPVNNGNGALENQRDGDIGMDTTVQDQGGDNYPVVKNEQYKFESAKKNATTSRHKENKNGDVWYCSVPECEFKTAYKRNLTLHTLKHNGVKRFLCDKCPYSTPDSTCLTSHQKHNHDAQAKFKCTDCDFTSIMRMEILRHYRNRHLQQKIYACNQCDYRTGYTYLLKFHLMSHAGIKPFKCSLCDYQVCNGTKVTRHIKTVHVGQEKAECIKLDLTFEIDAKQFKCAEPVNEKDIKVIELTDDEVKHYAERKRKEMELKKSVNEKKKRERLKKLNNKKTSKTRSVKMVSLLGNVELIIREQEGSTVG